MQSTRSETRKIYLAGHNGMVGSAIRRHFKAKGRDEIVVRRSSELDLRDASAVKAFYQCEKPDTVIVAAAKVGGIEANRRYPADFLDDNLAIAQNVIHGAYESEVSRLLFLGSSCIYPREAPQPMTEDCLLGGPLEKTNEGYAIAKIAGLKLCEYYRKQYGVMFHSAMPTNLYGPGDNYHPQNSHVLPALLRRFHEAKEANAPSVTIWGSGRPKREFLHVDDLAVAIDHMLGLDEPPDWMNVGTGTDITIWELAERVSEVVGYRGKLVSDPSKPDGTPRKLLDISKIRATGWEPRIGLEEGLHRTYQSFLEELQTGSLRA